MDECCGDEDASTEMLAEEEHLWRNLHPLDLLGYDWETTATD
jgi:hypothetical protein